MIGVMLKCPSRTVASVCAFGFVLDLLVVVSLAERWMDVEGSLVDRP